MQLFWELLSWHARETLTLKAGFSFVAFLSEKLNFELKSERQWDKFQNGTFSPSTTMLSKTKINKTQVWCQSNVQNGTANIRCLTSILKVGEEKILKDPCQNRMETILLSQMLILLGR